VIFIKSSANTATLQPENCLSIAPFTGNPKDRELYQLMAVLDLAKKC